MLRNSRATLDRVVPAISLPGGKAGAHVPEICRMIDCARNTTRSEYHTPLCSDYLEASLVANNGLRISIDDKRAEEVLEDIREGLAQAWSNEKHLVQNYAREPARWTELHADNEEVLAVWGALEGLPRESLQDNCAEVTAAALEFIAPGKDAPSLAERGSTAAAVAVPSVDDEQKKEEEKPMAEAVAPVDRADEDGFQSNLGLRRATSPAATMTQRRTSPNVIEAIHRAKQCPHCSKSY